MTDAARLRYLSVCSGIEAATVAWHPLGWEGRARKRSMRQARLRRAVGIGVDMAKPYRVQLSRRKGWRMPDNTVKVDRSTKWGNPFVVGVDGNAARSVELYRIMLGGHFCISCKTEFADQKAAVTYAGQNIKALRGKNLACWCRAGQPCHADVLLEIANQ